MRTEPLERIAVRPALLGLVLVLAGWASPGYGQPTADSSPEVSAEDREMTDSLIVASSEYQKADAHERTAKLNRLFAAAKKREARMATLMERNTKKFLKLALPKKLRDAMPATVKPQVEEETEAEGRVEVLHEDYVNWSQYRYVLQAADGELAVHFAADAPELQTGARVKIKGVKLKKAMAVGSGKTNVQTLTAAAPLVSGAQATAVILVNFSDMTSQPYTPDQIRQLVFGTTSDFDKENSYQQAWLTGEVFGWYTIALSSGVCDYNQLASQARSAASAAGVTLSGYKRYVYIFPQNACQWWGLGTIGGSPSHAWVNGDVQLRVVAHEMGHNFGLYHSHALECGNETIGTGCQNIEYGDTVDVMGAASGHFNSFQKERLGWLNSTGTPPITTALTGGQYLVDAYETLGTTPKALKVLKSTDGSGLKTWYYVEYRQPIGFDSFLGGNGNVSNGVVIHSGSESSPDASFLLDLTPNTDSWYDPALTTQQAFQDPGAGVGLSVAWLTGTTAAVNVTLGGQACVRAKPELSVTPSQGVVTDAGTTATFSLTVTNKDNSACAGSDFSVALSPPSGWTATAPGSPVSLNPGATTSTPVEVTSPAATADGSYDSGILVTNNADSAQSSAASARYIVSTTCSRFTPSVLVSPDTSGPLKAGTPFTYTVSVVNNDSTGCAPASFTFRLSVPNKLTGAFADAALTLAPKAAGSTTLTVTSIPLAPIKSYTLNVAATNVDSGKKGSDKALYVVGSQ